MIPHDTPVGTVIRVQLSDGRTLITRTTSRPRRVCGKFIVTVTDGRGFSVERCSLDPDAAPA